MLILHRASARQRDLSVIARDAGRELRAVLRRARPTRPVSSAVERKCTPQRYEEITRSLDLDKPMVQQFARATSRASSSAATSLLRWRHDRVPAPCLGYSFTLGQPVTSCSPGVPVTVSLVARRRRGRTSPSASTSASLAARTAGHLADRALVGQSLTSARSRTSWSRSRRALLDRPLPDPTTQYWTPILGERRALPACSRLAHPRHQQLARPTRATPAPR